MFSTSPLFSYFLESYALQLISFRKFCFAIFIIRLLTTLQQIRSKLLQRILPINTTVADIYLLILLRAVIFYHCSYLLILFEGSIQ